MLGGFYLGEGYLGFGSSVTIVPIVNKWTKDHNPVNVFTKSTDPTNSWTKDSNPATVYTEG